MVWTKEDRRIYDHQYHLANRERHNTREYKRQVKCAGHERPERCEICDRLPDGSGRGVLVFDHDHDHCKYGCALCFRGWICHSCNVSLGHADDSMVILNKQIDYLRRSRASRLRAM